jgi:hypothetical protein
MSTNFHLPAPDRAAVAFTEVMRRVMEDRVTPDQLFPVAFSVAQDWVIPAEGEVAEEMALAMVSVVLDMVEEAMRDNTGD